MCLSDRLSILLVCSTMGVVVMLCSFGRNQIENGTDVATAAPDAGTTSESRDGCGETTGSNEIERFNRFSLAPFDSSDFLSLSSQERRRIISIQGEKKNFVALEEIVLMNIEESSEAALILVQNVADDRAVDFFEKIPLDAPMWELALLSLWDRPQALVTPVLQRIVSSSGSAFVKGRIYLLCKTKGWPELLPYAVLDANDERPLFLWNADPATDTLAGAVRAYREKVKPLKESLN